MEPTGLAVAVRGAAAVATGEDRLFVVGGHRYNDFDNPTDAIQSWSPGSKAVVIGTLPSPRAWAAAAWAGDRAYVFGGGAASTRVEALDEIVRVGPDGTATVLAARLPTPRIGVAAVTAGDHIFLIGGRSVLGSEDAATDILRFDPATETLTPMFAKLPVGRAFASAVWANGSIYIYHGERAPNRLNEQEVLRYDPVKDALVSANIRLVDDFDRRVHAFSYGGRAYVVSESGAIFRHDFANGTISKLADRIPEPVRYGGIALAATSRYAYLVGGSAYGVTTSIVRYDPHNELPVPSFNITLDGLRMRVDGSAAADADGRIVSYAWDWGDGGRGEGRLAAHEYARTGWYNVTLTVRDDRGEATRLTQRVRALGANVAPTLDWLVKIDGLHVVADAGRSHDPDGENVTYTWDWGDGSEPSEGIRAEHAYARFGDYAITITAVDERGGVTQSRRELRLEAPPPPNLLPVARFTWTADGGRVVADATGSSDDHGIASYRWSWGDGTTSDGGPIQEHVYVTSGSYPVTLVVTDTGGRSAQHTQNVQVEPKSAPVSGAVPAAAAEPGSSGTSFPWGLLGLAAVGTGGVAFAMRRRRPSIPEGSPEPPRADGGPDLGHQPWTDDRGPSYDWGHHHSDTGSSAYGAYDGEQAEQEEESDDGAHDDDGPVPPPPDGLDEELAYEMLDLEPGATLEQIKAAHRRLALQYHPDRVAHLGPEFRTMAEAKMKRINEAYDLLRGR